MSITAKQFEFMQYVANFNKQYNSLDEFQMRFELFAETNAIIKNWNADETRTSSMGLNFLSDWTFEEKAKLRGLVRDDRPPTINVIEHDINIAVPNAVNWVTAGKVGPVKDQGQCGSCWAFSATAAVESNIAITTGLAVPNFAEQQLVACSGAYGNGGCNGGWYYWAWDYMKVNAQENTSSYPYTSGTTGVDGACMFNSSLGKVKVTSYSAIGTTNTAIMAAITTQPVSVALDAATHVFQSYTSGVVTNGCGTMLDHAVTAVGFGTDVASGLDYFLVRNSWGASWGDQGYIKIGQSKTGGSPGYCGINEAVYTVNAVMV